MLIEAQDISVTIGGRLVLDGESVRCNPGIMTALVGASGSGKTTLLHCLGMLLPVDKGKILSGGNDVTRYSNAARRRFWHDHAAFILQDYGIMDEESVAFNVTMKAGILGRRVLGDKERLVQSLEQTGLKDRESELAGHLSGGEKQRLALARAIYKNADVLFVDEPTASLDAANRHKVIELLADFASIGRTVIISTHDSEMIDACSAIHQVGSKERHVN
ncbi:ABC transporter [Niallia circulans]|uniref:ABC transporter ATP-binding protein n=1 Tax=Niallia TaxID=2837506 RepID=UPI00077C4396|nr:ATP-binding cassette domain-containing protein [Niallia circulans]MDR4318070.1 ATP-binding cassette domain-containing protein [Niallia circulans]MED3838585.1 ATP-binding cassette domain-containing protein [Niallia circulans]MED4244527.1 ATP-binding cassette domain-containing protein [Niallia circulans]MED4249448.1 ATP-binding cassette domain-containing protein [Niallia circulans]QKH59482.1 ATP-binding cassette domain-containing protein [Niallia circulans]